MISVITLPYAVMPPILNPLIKIFGASSSIHRCIDGVGFPSASLVKGRACQKILRLRGRLQVLIDNIKDPKIFFLL
jgi:hypothetical protein